MHSYTRYNNEFNQRDKLESILKSRKKSNNVSSMMAHRDVNTNLMELSKFGMINSRRTSYQILKKHDSSYVEDLNLF